MRQRVPVLVGITDTAFQESLNVARWAADAGADALVVAPPYYLPEGQPELQEYLDHLVPELPLPAVPLQHAGAHEGVDGARDDPPRDGRAAHHRPEGQLGQHDLSPSHPRAF